MSLKKAVFEIKAALMNQIESHSEEIFIQELEERNGLGAGRLVFYYNNLLLFQAKRKEQEASAPTKKVNRKWSKNEVDFMFQYIHERQDEGELNITEIIEEVAQLLDRGYQSVNYKYYALIKQKDKEKKQKQEEYHFTTIPQEELTVQSTEAITKNDIAITSGQTGVTAQTDSDDLLDILSGLISNVQQLPGLNLNQLLKSLYQLTNMALQNQDAAQQLENVKSEINFEKEALRDKLAKQEQQLNAEKKRNDELQAEVKKLAKEISAFNRLEDTAKIQNLKSYNQRLNYLIDNFGVVLQVGS